MLCRTNTCVAVRSYANDLAADARRVDRGAAIRGRFGLDIDTLEALRFVDIMDETWPEVTRRPDRLYRARAALRAAQSR